MWKLNDGTWIKKLFSQQKTQRTNRPPKPHEESLNWPCSLADRTTGARTPKYQFSQGEAPFPDHKNRLFDWGWRRYYLSRTSSVSPPLVHTRTAADTGESVSHESKAN
jgi:hypothetical protein